MFQLLNIQILFLLFIGIPCTLKGWQSLLRLRWCTITSWKLEGPNELEGYVVVTNISSAKYCDKWMHHVDLQQLSACEVQLPLSPPSPTSDNGPRQMKSWWPKKTPPCPAVVSNYKENINYLLVFSLGFFKNQKQTEKNQVWAEMGEHGHNQGIVTGRKT